MSAPSAVVFDLGGVLVGLDPAWPRRMGARPDDVRGWLARSEVFADFERGCVSPERFADALGRAFGVSASVARAAFASWVRGPLPGAVALLDALRVPAFALSNTNADHWAIFDPERRLRDRLTGIASHHIGARKPERAAFERASAIVGARTVLFLDDSSVNVEAARRWGWQAEVVEGIEASRLVLRRYGLLG